MHKLNNTVVEKIASVLLAVVFVSVFYTYIQASNAQQTIQSKDDLKIQIDKEIEAHKVKIKNLELKKFSEKIAVQKTIIGKEVRETSPLRQSPTRESPGRQSPAHKRAI